MEALNIDQVVIEGVDKTGKDSIMKYIDTLGKHKYALYQRGHISNVVYARIFDREEHKYTLNPHSLYVLLTADPEDLDIRFKLTNEPYTDIKRDLNMFDKVFKEMTAEAGVHTLIINTTDITLYNAAKLILDTCESLNK